MNERKNELRKYGLKFVFLKIMSYILYGHELNRRKATC